MQTVPLFKRLLKSGSENCQEVFDFCRFLPKGRKRVVRGVFRRFKAGELTTALRGKAFKNRHERALRNLLSVVVMSAGTVVVMGMAVDVVMLMAMVVSAGAVFLLFLVLTGKSVAVKYRSGFVNY